MSKKNLFLFGFLMINVLSFSNIFDRSEEFKKFERYLNENEKIVFEKIFDTNNKLIDSYEMDIKYLKKTAFNYEKKALFFNKKIVKLKEENTLILRNLETRINENPEKYLNTEKTNTI